MAQAIILHPVAVPFKPVGTDLLDQPLRREGSQIIQDRTYHFSDAFQVGERAHAGQHMGGIGALLATSFKPAALFADLQKPIQQQRLLLALYQTCAKFG